MFSTKEEKFVDIPWAAIRASLLLHSFFPLLFLMLTILEYFGISVFPKPQIHKEYNTYIQVDVVGLPDTTPPESKMVEQKSKIVTKPKIKEAPPMPAYPTVADTAKLEKLRKIEQEKALKKLEAEAKKEQALKKLNEIKQAKEEQEAQRTVLKGNKTSQGTATTGNIGQAKELYFSKIQQMIKEKFNIYSWQQKKNLVTVVFIRILPNGKLKEKRIISASKDPLYDNAVLQAIVSAQPFPIPERPEILDEGITFDFHPESN